ncbi:hypothetical protein M885DRAFT_507203 [Pelagophyceae sp. CCMP2097]|nr:hypothetical protein M885DRAFT_507203 [Pelagophyceae sp. CCMP2097]
MAASRRAMSAEKTYLIAGKELQGHQLVMVLIGFYTVVGITGKLVFGGGKKEEAAPVAASASTSAEVLSIFDDGFDEWSKSAANMAKWEASFNDM